MSNLPFMPVAVDAYLAESGHLSDAEQGRYFLLLCELWRAPQARLPNDDKWLARRFRRPPEAVTAELRPLIAEFFQATRHWIKHKRLTSEWQRAKRLTQQRSSAGKSRWDKEKSRYERNADARSERSALTPIHTRKTSLSRNDAPPRYPTACRLSADWAPSSADSEFARCLGLVAEPVAEKFRDYWRSQPLGKGLKSDWSAAWRHWCRNERPTTPYQKPRASHTSKIAAALAGIARARAPVPDDGEKTGEGGSKA